LLFFSILNRAQADVSQAKGSILCLINLSQ
jgi:hypothetical protein